MKRRMQEKYKKRMTALLSAVLVISLVGCGGTESGRADKATKENAVTNNDNSVTAKGRYIETQLNTPAYFQGNGELTQLSDGRLVLVDYDNGIKNSSNDNGMTWDSEDISEIQKLRGEGFGVNGAVAPDGGLFLYYLAWNGEVEGQLFPERYVYVAADGTKTEFELGLEEYRTYTRKAVFGSDGRLFIVADGAVEYGVYEINLPNQSAELLFELGAAEDLEICANEIQLLAHNGHEVFCYRYDTGEVTTEDVVLNSFIEEQTDIKPGIVFCNGMENTTETLVLASVGGIYHHVMGGSVLEQLADGSLNNLGDPTKTPISLLQIEEKSFLILYDNGELYSYIYDPEAATVPEEQITVYSLYDNETVRRAINVFRSKNPDVFVKFEIGLTGEDGMTENDAVRTLNTRLLAGEGPDLLLLNGMPMDSYIEKGILADLSNEVEELNAEHTFFEGILEGYRQEDGIYAIPFRYEIPLLSGSKADIHSVTDLVTLTEAVEQLADSGWVEETVMGNYTAQVLLEKLYPLCAGGWITEDDKVDEEALREFLGLAKRIYQAEQKNLDENERLVYEKLIANARNYSSEEVIRKASLGMNSQVFDKLVGKQAIIAGYLYSMEDYQEVLSINKKYSQSSEEYSVQIWTGQEGNVFCPTGIVGLSSNAKNPECAKRFLKTLLQEEVQEEDMEDGFPVNQDAFAEFAKDPDPSEDYSYIMSNEEGEVFELFLHWPNEEETEALKELIGTLDTPAMTDDYLKDTIISIGAKALMGEKEIDEGVEEIVQKISLWLQE